MKLICIIPLIVGMLIGCHSKEQNTYSLKRDSLWDQAGFMRHSARQGGVKLTLRGIYLKDGLLWLSFEAHNRSAFDFKIDWLVFSIRQRHRARRKAIQEIRVQPVFVEQPSLIPSDSSVSFVYGMMPRVLGKEKELLVELRERNGDRRIRLIVKARELLKARKVAVSAEPRESGSTGAQPRQREIMGRMRPIISQVVLIFK